MMVRLTDAELATVMTAARPIAHHLREAFLQAVAELARPLRPGRSARLLAPRRHRISGSAEHAPRGDARFRQRPSAAARRRILPGPDFSLLRAASPYLVGFDRTAGAGSASSSTMTSFPAGSTLPQSPAVLACGRSIADDGLLAC
jgi:hypothetical protein